jgi:cytochrome c553
MRFLKILGIGVGLLVVLFLATAGILNLLSARQLNKQYSVEAEPPLALPADSASLARGFHLATAVATCTICHGDDFGGAVYADAGPLGLIAGPNLTRGRGGVAGLRTNVEWERAIRHGVRPEGTSLIVMPSEVYVHLSDEDLTAVIASIRQASPVDRELPPTHFRLLGRVLLGAGRLPLLVAEKTPPLVHVPAVKPDTTVSYGSYLADIGGCHGCHGFGLSGGRVAGPYDLPPASNLTVLGKNDWTESDFERAMRNGVRPDGSRLNEFMPWQTFRHMTEEELHALWLYLASVPVNAFGNK